jgi:hypothetical protein
MDELSVRPVPVTALQVGVERGGKKSVFRLGTVRTPLGWGVYCAVVEKKGEKLQ